MQPRSHVFRAGCTIVVFAGAMWVAAARRAGRESTLERPSLPPATTFTQTTDGTAKFAGVNPAATVPPAGGTGAPPLELIGGLLDRQRRLGPADRGDEDEIRCTLLSLLTDDNAGTIVRALPEDGLHSEFGVAALARWAATDVLAASLWLAQQPAPSSEQTWAVAQALVKDAVVLEALGEELPAGPWREALLKNASRASLPDNPVGAVHLAYRLQSGTERTRALLTIADEWVQRDPTATTRWIANEPDPALHDELVLAAAAAQASTDPLGALDRTLAISSDVTFAQAVGKITTMWTDFAPDRAQSFTVLLVSRGSSSTASDPGVPP
jgi:hypothetical protein